jgi:hypothetical protein
LVLLALAAPAAALNVSACGTYTDINLIVTTNIAASAAGATCLTIPRNAVLNLNGHLISGFGQDDAGSIGIKAIAGDAFILGPGIVKGFETCIHAGDHVAVEDLITNQCATGIKAGRSYKIKEVRVHDCTSSVGPNIGIDLSTDSDNVDFDDECCAGGFIESSIVRACDFGVITGKNNKIWNLVVSFHNDVGLEVGGGTAVSRTVISTPASTSTIGLDYSDCCQLVAGTLEPNGSPASTHQEGCQDGSNSVQDHLPGLNIIVEDEDCSDRVMTTAVPTDGHLRLITAAVITDGHTSCAGDIIPNHDDDGRVSENC